MLSGITSIIFDFDHTLGSDHRLEERVLQSLAERYCSIEPTDQQLASALATFRSGALSLGQTLFATFENWGYAGDLEAEFRFEALRLLPGSLTPMPGARETLDGLATRGVEVAILTNGWTELQQAKASLIDFDGPVFISEEIGAWKPDPRAFDVAVRAMRTESTKVVYVGDSPHIDVAGAKHAGMVAAWIDFEGRPYPENVIRPDLTISRLEELLEL